MRFKDYIAVSCSTLMLTALVCLLTLPASVQAWTSAGPWGGVIHDVQNVPAGGDTLYAGTGNGLYARNVASESYWTAFDETLGYRVLQILPDEAAGLVYAVVKASLSPISASSYT
jgi:hypothetical protein